MKALVLQDYGKFVFMDVPRPELHAPDDVIVRVRASSICGSDVHGMDGSTGRRRPPIIMGHEAAGEIVETGTAVHGFAIGDRVTFDSTEYCGSCWHCRRGEVNLCDSRRVLGVSCEEYHRDGAFAEYIILPERILYSLPEALDYIRASLVEPLSVAVHAAAITPFSLHDSVAVVGTGLIGLFLVQVLRGATSGRIFAFDTDPARREAALGFGADAALDPANPDAMKELRNLNDGRGVDRAFEAVGAAAPIRTAIEAVRKGGSVTLIGNFSPTVEIPLQTIVARQLSLLGSCAISGEYPLALDLMARRKIDVQALISTVAPLSDGASWFARLYAREPGLLKVVLEP